MTTTVILREGEEHATNGDRDRPAPPSRGRRLVGVAGIAALAIPFVAIGVAALTRPWLPAADLALIELRTADVGGPRSPLLGAYSRLGWHHPGPLMFWLLALPYRLAGSRPLGMLAGAAAIHAAAVGGSVALAHRRGGRVLAAGVALGMAALIHGYGAGFLVLFWNPYLPVLATAFLVLAVWSVMEGDTWLLPVVVAVSCFTWQSHLGYLPVTGALAAVAVAVALWREAVRPAPDTTARRWTRPAALAAATAAAAAVCLAPLAIEEATNDPGNLTRIRASLSAPDAEQLGLPDALSIVVPQLSPLGPWIAGQKASTTRVGTGPLQVALSLAITAGAATAAALAARRAGADSAARLVGLIAATAVVAVLAVARTVGPPFAYLYGWLRPISMLLWLALAWTLVQVVRQRGWLTGRSARAASRMAVLGTALATAGLASASMTSGLALTLPDETTSLPLQELGPAAVAAAGDHPRVRLAMGGGWCAGELGHGVGVQLVEHGIEVAVDEDLALEYGPERVSADALPVIELVCGPGAGEVAARSPIAPVTTVGLLSGAELDELRSLQEGFRTQLRAEGREDLVPVVDNQALLTLEGVAASGEVAFDERRLARFTELMERSRHAAALFLLPRRSS